MKIKINFIKLTEMENDLEIIVNCESIDYIEKSSSIDGTSIYFKNRHIYVKESIESIYNNLLSLTAIWVKDND